VSAGLEVGIAGPGPTTPPSEAKDWTLVTSDNTSVGPYICDAREYGDVENLPIDKILVGGQLLIHPALTGSDYLTVSLKGNQLQVRAGHYVGLLPINRDVVVRVRPRVTITSLSRILRISGYVPAEVPALTRDYPENEEGLPSILGVLAEAFVGAAEQVVQQGLLQEYESTTIDTSFPRGRILIGASLRHQLRGNPSRVKVQFAERKPDGPLNRLLKYVVVLLARQYSLLKQPRSGTMGIVRRLNRLYWHLRPVEYDSTLSFLNDRRVQSPETIPFSRAYYIPAVRLASLLVRGRGVEIGPEEGAVELPILLLDLAEAFEAYLRNALARELGVTLPGSHVLNGQDWVPGGRRGIFDPPNNHTPQATPDIVVHPPYNGSGQTPLVIEVKYKPMRDAVPRDDLNQTLTYGFAYGARVALLAYPTWEAEASSLTELGTIGELRVLVYRFNLGATSLQAEEEAFGKTVASLVAPRSDAAAAWECRILPSDGNGQSEPPTH